MDRRRRPARTTAPQVPTRRGMAAGTHRPAADPLAPRTWKRSGLVPAVASSPASMATNWRQSPTGARETRHGTPCLLPPNTDATATLAHARFPGPDHFAAYNGTAPIEVSSGPRKIYRLSRRGNRRLNHAIHMAAVTQIRYRHSPGRAYYDRKLAEGKTPKEALRSLKRQLSDTIFARLQADARRAAAGPR